jgi:hypothetical protein
MSMGVVHRYFEWIYCDILFILSRALRPLVNPDWCDRIAIKSDKLYGRLLERRFAEERTRKRMYLQIVALAHNPARRPPFDTRF